MIFNWQEDMAAETLPDLGTKTGFIITKTKLMFKSFQMLAGVPVERFEAENQFLCVQATARSSHIYKGKKWKMKNYRKMNFSLMARSITS